MANILIVDDDPTFVHLLTNLIASFGETPISAMQGADFFKIIQEESIDLILLDIYMPIINGLTLIKQLKNHQDYNHIPVIMITGATNLNMMTECFEAGASDFISKPISPVVLQARLTSILEKQKDIDRLKKEIHERKKAEASLRKLSIAMEQSPNILFLIDERHRIEYANPKCLEVTGYKLDEIIGRSPNIFQAESENETTYNQIFQTLSKTDLWKGNLCNQKKNGDLFWVSCSISPVLNDDGKVSDYLFIQEDITDRMKSEKILDQKTRSLEISENRLRTIIEATNDGIVVVGKDKMIHFVNPAAERLFDKASTQLVGEIFPYPLIPNQMTKINIIRSGKPDIDADLRVVSTETDDGAVWVASIREISQTRRKHSNDDATQSEIIQKPSTENNHRRLQSEKEPGRIEKNIQNSSPDILSNISHEFRTPMHAILSFANFGIKKIQQAPREKLLHYFEQIKLSANRLMPVINGLLELYKLESDQRMLTTRKQDILPVINFVIHEQQIFANEKQIEISLVPPQCETIVHMNKHAIMQVVRNVLQNAIHYSEMNSLITITIDTLTDNDEKWLVVNISDEGVGIPEDELKDIFSKFYKCEHTNSNNGGTGIGLTICKHIISGHGGKIWAKNNPDKGTCIRFTLPLM
jgi:PAS domain S-box-containing protein